MQHFKKFSQTNIEFIKFLFLGSIMTFLDWIGFYALYKIFDIQYIIASIVMFVLISALGLVIYKKAIFGDSYLNLKNEILAIYGINICGIILNSGILWLCVEYITLNPMLGKIIASFLVAFFSFFARKKWVYKNPKNSNT